MAKKTAPPQKGGGRYGLPGIPSYIDRVSQETIYADKIRGEERYLDQCKGVNVGDHKQAFGVLKGFEIIKFPSYVEVRKVYDPEVITRTGLFVVEQPESKPRNPKSVAQRTAEARAECNRTAPTYAYKYFSEKHMSKVRGGPMANRRPKSLADLKAEAPTEEELRGGGGGAGGTIPPRHVPSKQLRAVQSEPKFRKASGLLETEKIMMNAGSQA